ncbi:hypothetical protein K438DRAFT_1786474 [Mycena galopus ATCC 62051]|nr:hypothetical protein K438DRAFT_1786474 [Mycena galopus ATCC 62051]
MSSAIVLRVVWVELGLVPISVYFNSKVGRINMFQKREFKFNFALKLILNAKGRIWGLKLLFHAVYMSLKIVDSSRPSRPQVDLLDSGVDGSRLLSQLCPTESELAATLLAGNVDRICCSDRDGLSVRGLVHQVYILRIGYLSSIQQRSAGKQGYQMCRAKHE